MLRCLVSFTLSLVALCSAQGIHASDFFAAETPNFASFASTGYVAQREPVQLRLLAEDKAVQPGRAFWIALQVDLDKGWHTYWKNSGDSGLGTSVEWALPSGFQVMGLDWPTPERFEDKTLVSFGYAEPFILLAKVMPGKGMASESDISLEATIRWIACNEGNCIPGDCSAKLNLPVSKSTPLRDAQHTTLFSKARDQLPQQTWSIKAKDASTAIQLSLQPPASNKGKIEEAYFLPADTDSIDFHSAIALKSNAQGTYTLDLDKISTGKTPESLEGLLLLKKIGQSKPIAVNVNVPMSEKTIAMADKTVEASAVAPNAHDFDGGLGLALAMAFVGGMILNLMPCVLPVISLKILSIVKMAGHHRVTTFKHGVAFTIGVLISFWLLAGILLALQAYGHAVGWGFQLQEPIFVAILAAVLLVFALSLFGVFEMGTTVASWAGQKESHNNKKATGYSASFFNGVLATAVATPCTGPFLGAAIGYAVTLPPASAMLIFTVLGLGMAFPYLMLTLFPNLTKWLPKPGDWMITFKQLMAFMLIATILWLILVFGVETNHTGVFLLLCSLFLLTVTCWIYGKWCHPMRSQRVQRAATLASIFMALFASYVLVISSQMEPDPNGGMIAGDFATSESNPRAWLPFSPTLIEELRAAGKPVFIDFTAKWCVICQTNHLVLLLDDIEKKFEDLGIAKIKADWTRPDPAITKELKRYGRNGVPLYLLYMPGVDVPLVLPQVLTPDIVTSYLEKMQHTIAENKASTRAIANP